MYGWFNDVFNAATCSVFVRSSSNSPILDSKLGRSSIDSAIATSPSASSNSTNNASVIFSSIFVSSATIICSSASRGTPLEISWSESFPLCFDSYNNDATPPVSVAITCLPSCNDCTASSNVP